MDQKIPKMTLKTFHLLVKYLIKLENLVFLLTIERAFSKIEVVLGEVRVEKWLVISARM